MVAQTNPIPLKPQEKTMTNRPDNRPNNQARDISIETGFNPYAEGSCLIKFGNTHVLCTASVDENVPRWLKGTNQGWVTAEYGMLPRSTHNRMDRKRTNESGRTQEISRLIGRSLRAGVDLHALGERQIRIDCDVIQADGGTRTAGITGGFVALYLACEKLVNDSMLSKNPITQFVSAISCGIRHNDCILDLNYDEDSTAQADSNFVLTADGNIIEIQGTAEDSPFTPKQFAEMLNLATQGCAELTARQKQALGL